MAVWRHPWGELGAHGGHFWDMWAPVCIKVQFLSAKSDDLERSRVVKGGKRESLAAGAGPAEGGEASPPSFADDFYTIV